MPVAEPGALLSLERGGARLVLSLEPDPRAERPAMARGGGHALCHAQRLDGALGEIARALAAELAATRHPTPAAAALDRLRDEAARRGAELRWLASLPAALALPRWPAGMRRGAPRSDAPWPFDPEVTASRLGLRRLVKRDRLGPADLPPTARWLSHAGLRVGDAGHGVLLAAVDEATLAAGLAAEARLRLGGEARDEASAALGGLLGYPRCCVDAYLSLGVRDDRFLLPLLLPREGTYPPHTLWCNGALALVSHAPCALGCEASTALGRDLLDALDRGAPGFAARWTALARREHVVDTRGALYARGVLGTLRIAPSSAAPGVSAVAHDEAARPIDAWLRADHRG